MPGQRKLTSFYPVVVPIDSKRYQMDRLHSECLLAYKLRFFKYRFDNIPDVGQRRLYWYFMDASLHTDHPLHPQTFRKIIISRSLSFHALQSLDYRLWLQYTEVDFNNISSTAVLSMLFTLQELAFAASE